MKMLFQNAKMVCLIAAAFWIASSTAIQAQVDAETPAASYEEKGIAFDKAPSAVQETIKQHAGNASIDLFKQFENGRFVYEATYTREGVFYELKLATDGTVLMKREPRFPVVIDGKTAGTELPLWRAPALVQETIREQTGTNVVKRFLKQGEADDLMYRADFVRKGVPVQILVAENGTLISPSAQQQIRQATRGKK